MPESMGPGRGEPRSPFFIYFCHQSFTNKDLSFSTRNVIEDAR